MGMERLGIVGTDVGMLETNVALETFHRAAKLLANLGVGISGGS